MEIFGIPVPLWAWIVGVVLLVGAFIAWVILDGVATIAAPMYRQAFESFSGGSPLRMNSSCKKHHIWLHRGRWIASWGPECQNWSDAVDFAERLNAR